MKDLFKFPLNIQLFADGGNEGTGPEENNQENDDGEETPPEKTFTQAEVNALIAKEKARVRQRAKSAQTSKEDDEGEETPPAQPEVNPYIEKYAQAEIKVAMAQQGIDAGKVNRAVRLIDHGDVLTEDGDIDVEKLNTAIADLLKDWPELAPQQGESNAQFKIGSDKNKNKGKENDLIANAFGNNT